MATQWRRRTLTAFAAVALAAAALVSGLALAAGTARPPRSARSPQYPVQVHAAVGWGGEVVPGAAVPAVVELVNRSHRQLDGAVEAVDSYAFQHDGRPAPFPVSASSGPITYSAASAYGVRLALPARTRKRVTFFFPLTETDRIVVRFVSSGRVLGFTEVALALPAAGAQPATIGALAASIPPELHRIRLAALDGAPQALMVLPLAPNLVPPVADEMDAFPTLLVDGYDRGALSPAQQAAVAEWVRAGGRLVLGGGAAAAEDLAVLPAADRPFAPPRVTSVRSSWVGASSWLGVRAPSGTAMAVVRWRSVGRYAVEPFGPPAAPLGQRADLGRGEVLAMAFDPAQAPWRSGPAAAALWRKVFAAVTPPGLPSPPPAGGPLGELIPQARDLPVQAFPDWRGIALYLLLFAAAVGPTTYLVLRRRGRFALAWLVVPLLALAFAGGEYTWMKARGADVIANAVRVVEDAGDGTQVYTAIGYFAPDHAAFTARLAGVSPPVQVGDSLAAPGLAQSGGAPDPLAPVPDAVLQDGDGLDVAFGAETRWGLRVVDFEQHAAPRATPAGHGLAAGMRLRRGSIVVTVRNRAHVRLQDVTLLVGREYQTLRTLAPGASAQLRLPVPATAASSSGPALGLGEDLMSLSWAVFLRPHLAGAGTGTSGGPVKPVATPGAPTGTKLAYLNPALLTVRERRDAAVLQTVLAQLSPRTNGPLHLGAPPLVVAWTQGRGGAGPWKGLPSRPRLLTMYAVEPALHLPRGPFTLPPAMVTPTSVAVTGSPAFGGPPPEMSLPPGGTTTFSFHVPIPVGARIRSVVLDVPIYPSSAAAQRQALAAPKGALQVYDFTEERWRPLGGARRFRLGPAVVGPGGAVAVRVAAVPHARSFWFQAPLLTVAGVAP